MRVTLVRVVCVLFVDGRGVALLTGCYPQEGGHARQRRLDCRRARRADSLIIIDSYAFGKHVAMRWRRRRTDMDSRRSPTSAPPVQRLWGAHGALDQHDPADLLIELEMPLAPRKSPRQARSVALVDALMQAARQILDEEGREALTVL